MKFDNAICPSLLVIRARDIMLRFIITMFLLILIGSLIFHVVGSIKLLVCPCHDPHPLRM